MLVYHCSTVKIDEFYIPYGGLHFGGIHSAIKCAVNKFYEARKNGIDLQDIHIHACELDISDVSECTDKGSDVGWNKYFFSFFKNEKSTKVLTYINLYETDIEKSFCIFDTRLVKIVDHSTMHIDLAEDLYKLEWDDLVDMYDEFR